MNFASKIPLPAVALAGCLLTTLPAQAAPTALFDATYTSAAGRSDLSVVYGNSFTVTRTLTATALGLFDHGNNGFVETHQVGLWNAAGTLLASTTFGPGQAGTVGPGTKPGSHANWVMRYLDVDDVVLQAGQVYRLAAVYPAPLLDWVGLASNVSSAYASGFAGAYTSSGSLVPARTALNDVIGVNLLVADEPAGTVPAPATGLLALTLFGVMALVRRRGSSDDATTSRP